MKKGFTLIELMVVIVIIGILAAIAVPKMFGMSAKAKAAEVLPAWGSWQKVAQAYALETSSVGDFKSIGFTPPGTSGLVNSISTSNWSYSGGASIVIVAGVVDAASRGSFSAVNIVKLNNCVVGTAYGADVATYNSAAGAGVNNTWISNFDPSGNITNKLPAQSDCSVLTPAFK